MNNLNRTKSMYDALADAAHRALQRTFDQVPDGQSLLQMTAEAKLADVENNGWNCSVIQPAELKAFAMGVIKGLEDLAATWHVESHPTFITAKKEVTEAIINLNDARPDSVNKLGAELTNLRNLIRHLKVELNENHPEMLRRIAADFLTAYEPARQDPSLANVYDALEAGFQNNETTGAELQQLLTTFSGSLTAFQESSNDFMNEVIASIHAQVAHFGLDTLPELVTFFQEVHLELAVATYPAEYIAISQLLEKMEPVLTDEIMKKTDLTKVRSYVTELYRSVKSAQIAGVPLSVGANETLNICENKLTATDADRDDYRDVMDLLRGVRFEG